MVDLIQDFGQEKSSGFESFLEKNKLPALILLIGVVLIGAGLLVYKIFTFETGPKVEILGETSSNSSLPFRSPDSGGTKEGDSSFLTVEASGEVLNPGVYKLLSGSRVNDLLTLAGGFSADADREWVAKNINLAMKLNDGVKIYIPRKPNPSSPSNSSNLSNFSNSYSGDKININNASESELDTLWGVGPATAKKIIDGRPYQQPEDLLNKKIVKSNVWEAIKDKVTVY